MLFFKIKRRLHVHQDSEVRGSDLPQAALQDILTFSSARCQRTKGGSSRMNVKGVYFFWPFALFLSLCLDRACAQEVLSYSIQEQSEAGAFVGNVARDSELYSRFTQDEFQQLQYSIAMQVSKFTIDENTSTIRTGQVLDREKECESVLLADPCEIEFDVGVYKWGQDTANYDLLMIVHVKVMLEDINDNSPIFPSKVVSLSVPESVSVDHVLQTSGAIDADTGSSNSIQRYQLLPDNGHFELQIMPSVDGMSSDLGIVIKRPLDRETQPVYRLVVNAFDGGFPQRSGSVNITIFVQDVNDNPPVFSRAMFNITVNEDTPINIPILRLSATDADDGQNSQLSFFFSSRTSSKIMEQFIISEATGDLVLIKPLDYEKDKRLQFVVEARDHGSPPQHSQAAVIVIIEDVNDNAPQIDIMLPPGGTSVAESLEVGNFIAHVSLFDADSGRNGEIMCTVADSHFRLERFSDVSYIFKILLREKLDYEVSRQHIVNVSCSDNGSPPQRNSSAFVIHVRDENDNAPIFQRSEYHISVRENNVRDQFVFQFFAMDLDSDENGNITYSLLENPGNSFAIDPVTGIMKASSNFDREFISKFHLVVQAKDKGTPSLSTTALVTVDIDDANDNPTHFAQPHFEFAVEEGRPKGTVVDTLRVFDLDTIASGQLQYSFLLDTTQPSEFDIDVYTGTITTTKKLDRESIPNVFDFRVFVVDAENVLFNDTASVTVTVTDANDHAPDITFPNTSNNTVKIAFNIPPGSILAKVEASDVDAGENGSVTYAIESGDTQDLFFMNGMTGELILARRIQASEAKTYSLVVAVQDSGRAIQMTTRSSLNVVITVSNESSILSQVGKVNHNIAIVVTLICVTFALALAVVATICIIRRIDRERKQHTLAKGEEHNIYKQETLPPASAGEKIPSLESYENELEKLKRKIKRELSFVHEHDCYDTSSLTNGTSFSTFKNASSTTSTLDHKMLSSPQASSSVLQNTLTPDTSNTTTKRVHYIDKLQDFNRLSTEPSSRLGRSNSPQPVHSQQTWNCQQPKHLATGAGEDAGSHTSGSTSTSDSGRGCSSEEEVHNHAGVCLINDSATEFSVHNPRSYHNNKWLSTFRSTGAVPGEAALLDGSVGNDTTTTTDTSTSFNNNASGMTSILTNNNNSSSSSNNSPRSHQPVQKGSAYSRNISFSDDSATANASVDRHISKQQQPAQQTQQQYSRVDSAESQKGAQPSPNLQDTPERKAQLRIRHQPSPRTEPSPMVQVNNSQKRSPRRTSHDALSSPGFRFPTEVSPLEDQSGDDSYGVRGKMVNFSIADSYQMTPRRSDSHLRTSGSFYRQPRQSSTVGDISMGSYAANKTAQSSFGVPYSMTDLDEVLCESALGTVDEEDRTTTTSGSYTINADDLCNEIDNLFFNDIVV